MHLQIGTANSWDLAAHLNSSRKIVYKFKIITYRQTSFFYKRIHFF